MNELTIQYQNFVPSAFTKEYLDAKLKRMLKRVPTGASVKAIFSVEGGGITATLRILTSAGEFFAISKGRFLKDVNRRLMVQVQRQIARWNSRRKGEDLPRGTTHDFDVA